MPSYIEHREIDWNATIAVKTRLLPLYLALEKDASQRPNNYRSLFASQLAGNLRYKKDKPFGYGYGQKQIQRLNRYSFA